MAAPLLDPAHFLKTVTANNNLLSHYREHLLTLEKIRFDYRDVLGPSMTVLGYDTKVAVTSSTNSVSHTDLGDFALKHSAHL